MNKFDFDSISAYTGKVFPMKSELMFANREDEEHIRKMVTDAFSGKNVPLPLGSYSVRGDRDDDHFKFDFYYTNGTYLFGNYFPPEFADVLTVIGTTNKDSPVPIIIAKTCMTMYGSIGVANPRLMEKLPVMNKPYGVDILTPQGIFSEFVLSGMSGQYSKAFTCVAIDILKSSS